MDMNLSRTVALTTSEAMKYKHFKKDHIAGMAW